MSDVRKDEKFRLIFAKVDKAGNVIPLTTRNIVGGGEPTEEKKEKYAETYTDVAQCALTDMGQELNLEYFRKYVDEYMKSDEM